MMAFYLTLITVKTFFFNVVLTLFQYGYYFPVKFSSLFWRK